MFAFQNRLGKLWLSPGAVVIKVPAQERFAAQGAAYSAEVPSATKAGRCKEKQSTRYYLQPCTVHLGPCTSARLPGTLHHVTHLTLN
jgi:hypothetical protein